MLFATVLVVATVTAWAVVVAWVLWSTQEARGAAQVEAVPAVSTVTPGR